MSSTYVWSEPIVANKTEVKEVHVDELREACDDIDARLKAHVGVGGQAQHPDVTSSVSGFMNPGQLDHLYHHRHDISEIDGYDPGSGGDPGNPGTPGASGSQIKVLTGSLVSRKLGYFPNPNGGIGSTLNCTVTLPLPDGYSESQCTFLATYNSIRYYTSGSGGADGDKTTELRLDQGCSTTRTFNTKMQDALVSYIIIGVK